MEPDVLRSQEHRLALEGTARQNTYFRELVERARTGEWRLLELLYKGACARFAEGHLTEGQYEYVDHIIRERRKPAEKLPAERIPRPAESYVGSRPITPASLLRRRRLAREAFVHPSDTEALTQGEMAVLTIVTEEIMKGGACRLPIGKIAALAGLSSRWVQHTLRKLKELLFVVVEYRPGQARRHETNVVTLHPSRAAIRSRLQAVKKWWRGRGPLQAIGRTLVRATRLERSERHPRTGDNSVGRAPSAPRGSPGGSMARPAPA